MHQFVELTVVTDSEDSMINPRKGSFRSDLIASFVDVNEQKKGIVDRQVKTRITLTEPGDIINTDDEACGVIRAQRTIWVTESYEEVKLLLQKVTSNG